MRPAVLDCAFHALGATTALSHAHPENSASLRVSTSLGYIHTATTQPPVVGRFIPEKVMTLSQDAWAPVTEIAGVAPVRSLLGADAPQP